MSAVAEDIELDVPKAKPGRGRPLGSTNKLTRDIKAACLEAFDRGGGTEWLLHMMKVEPRAYMGLLAKFIPSQMEAKVDVVTQTVRIDYTGLEPLSHEVLVIEQEPECFGLLE